MEFDEGRIVLQYEAIMNKKADVNTGETCSDASDKCRPIYYMPRYMFSRYADKYLSNGTYNFFKFNNFFFHGLILILMYLYNHIHIS